MDASLHFSSINDTGPAITLATSQTLYHLQISLTLLLLFAVCIFAFIARIFRSPKTHSQYLPNDIAPVPIEPYWVPFFGHSIDLVLNANGFLKRLRGKYSNGIFSLRLIGTRHHILHTPGLTQTFFAQHEKADTKDVAGHIGTHVFGLPKDELKKVDQAGNELHHVLKHLINEEDLAVMVNITANKARENLASFVTGRNQRPWEREAKVKTVVSKGEKPVAEASLFVLVRDFISSMSNTAIMGSDFLENFPDFFDDIWTVDREFFKLIAALPSWVPVPSLHQAKNARERVIQRLTIFEDAMEKKMNGQDPGPQWANLDDVGRLVKERMKIYRKYDWSLRARAANEHSLNWAANANSNSLTFWMLIRIYADDKLLARLREEVSSYVCLSSEDGESFDTFDVNGLVERCALLKSCYIECLRLHTASWSFKMVKEDFVLQARKENQGWLLRKGDYCHAAHELHNTDPNYFDHPLEFKPDRHIRYDDTKGYLVAELGSIRPYGGGTSMCKGRHFALKEVMLFTAAIIAMWVIEPAGGGDWKMPAHRKTTAAHGTDDECRVWISKRETA